MVGFVRNWLSRHRNPMCFWLHMLGIPACFIVTPIFLILQLWFMAVAFFVAGYALQFLGHLVEGNRTGEGMLLRRIFSRKKKRGDREGSE